MDGSSLGTMKADAFCAGSIQDLIDLMCPMILSLSHLPADPQYLCKF